MLAECCCSGCIDMLGAGGPRCCPTVLDRRSGRLDAEQPESSKPGLDPSGESDRCPHNAANTTSRRGLFTPVLSSFLAALTADSRSCSWGRYPRQMPTACWTPSPARPAGGPGRRCSPRRRATPWP